VRHDRCVRPDLDLDPDALRAVAATTRALRLALPVADPADLTACTLLPGGAALVEEAERLVASVRRAGRELAELEGALHAAAARAEAADQQARAVIARMPERPA
jgi:hypothetical protein